MKTPNFFCSLHTLKTLSNGSPGGINLPEEEVRLSMDLIELPLWISFSASPKKATMKVFPRHDACVRSKSRGSALGTMVAERESGSVRIAADHVSLTESLNLLFAACCNLCGYAQERILLKSRLCPDPEQAGILITSENGKPDFRIVSGQDRPDLMCLKLDGEAAMCRPYVEDYLAGCAESMRTAEELGKDAESGDESAMRLLSYAYLNGDEGLGIRKDPDRAAQWIRRFTDADAYAV